jgi:hypothetical protein
VIFSIGNILLGIDYPCVIQLSSTDLALHFGVNLSSVSFCCIFISLLAVLYSFCLVISKYVEEDPSIDKTMDWDCYLNPPDCRSRSFL